MSTINCIYINIVKVKVKYNEQQHQVLREIANLLVHSTQYGNNNK